MDEREFQAALAEHGFAVDEGNAIGGPFIPDGRYRIYRQETHEMLCDSKTYAGLIEEFETWLRFRRS